MAKNRRQSGFSLLELLIVVGVALVIMAFAVPLVTEGLRNFRLTGDARNIKSEILLAKMRAAARFTRSRVRADFGLRTFRTEIWNKTTNTWDTVSVGGPQFLAQGVNFGIGAMTTPPTDTDGTPMQAVLGLAPPCTDDALAPGDGPDIANTACVYFNSRGFPVDAVGTATPEGAIYVTSGDVVQGVTISINGIARLWRGDSSDTDYWIPR